jgi:DNA-binding CsgD family transcriptional regulator
VFFRKYGLGTAMSASVSPAPNTIVRLAAQGALDRPPFTEAECKVLEQLARHCERALSLACRASEQELIVRSVSEAIGRFGSAVFLLDHSGSVLWKNRASEELIGNGISLAGGKLSAEHRADQAMLRAAIQSAVSSEIADKLECPKPVLLRRDGERRPAVAQLIPVRTTGTRQLWSPLQQSAAICLITDLEREAETDPALVRDCLGLTLGEARVATQISHGRSPRDAAETLQITEETVRTVLKKIFAKTGISRQSELAAMLSRLPVLGPAQPATDRPARLADRNPALTDPR